MTDRELLELAARAAGLNVGTDEGSYDDLKWWDPLKNDGDALRLAVKLGIDIDFKGGGCWATEGVTKVNGFCEYFSNKDQYAATRRAIVRAAAEIGKGMRDFPCADEIREEWL